ncbi:MAG TPA: hypothetical protein ENI87_10140, partial [bacterium]|nr:hypothetical protein [bacterium]
MANNRAAFPVGLYAMLLFALAWLTLPTLFAPLERWLVGSACAVPRIAAAWFGQPVLAADRLALGRIEALGEELQDRVERHDFAGAGISMPVDDERILCGVLAVSRRGGGGQPSELLLDHSYAELWGCRALVTKGRALLGFLLEPGKGRARDDRPEDPARVILLHHRDAPRLYAALELDDGSRLRFVVRAAQSVDPAPLRVDLWDDPYRASQLDRPGQAVYTLPVQIGRQQVPGGLLLGRTRIWGYERPAGGETLTIGVFVTPPFEPRALSHVVLWRAAAAFRAPPVRTSLRARRRAAAVVYDLPGANRGRHLLVADTVVPEGAAVVQDGLFLGTARGLCFGAGLVTAFVASRQPWSLLFLPDGDQQSPLELRGRIERSDGDVGWLRWRGPDRDQVLRLGAGYLFTGSNGRFCPAGLWIG